MTFKEWCRATAKETPSKVPILLAEEVITTAIRVAIEELMANPADADLDISSICRFYLNHRVCHYMPKYRNIEQPNENATSGEENRVRWTLHCTPRAGLKDVLNGRKDIRTLLIGGGTPLYPEFMINSDGTRKKGKGRKRIVPEGYRTTFTITRNVSKSEYNRRLAEAKKELEKKKQEEQLKLIQENKDKENE